MSKADEIRAQIKKLNLELKKELDKNYKDTKSILKSIPKNELDLIRKLYKEIYCSEYTVTCTIPVIVDNWYSNEEYDSDFGGFEDSREFKTFNKKMVEKDKRLSKEINRLSKKYNVEQDFIEDLMRSHK